MNAEKGTLKSITNRTDGCKAYLKYRSINHKQKNVNKLQGLNLEAFLPIQQEMDQWGDREYVEDLEDSSETFAENPGSKSKS